MTTVRAGEVVSGDCWRGHEDSQYLPAGEVCLVVETPPGAAGGAKSVAPVGNDAVRGFHRWMEGYTPGVFAPRPPFRKFLAKLVRTGGDVMPLELGGH